MIEQNPLRGLPPLRTESKVYSKGFAVTLIVVSIVLIAAGGFGGIGTLAAQSTLPHWVTAMGFKGSVASFAIGGSFGFAGEIAGIILAIKRYLINKKDESGNTQLHRAIGRRNKTEVEALLEKGANPNIYNNERKKPLQLAVETGKAQIADLLLSYGALTNAEDAGREAAYLYVAVKIGTAEDLRGLLESGIDVNTVIDFTGNTPLHFAAEGVSLDHVNLLIEKKATIDAKNLAQKTPFFKAVEGNIFSLESARVSKEGFSVLEALQNAGADINTQDSRGNTPLHYAVKNNDGDVMVHLVDLGANCDIKNASGYRAMQVANVNGNMQQQLDNAYYKKTGEWYPHKGDFHQQN